MDYNAMVVMHRHVFIIKIQKFRLKKETFVICKVSKLCIMFATIS